MQQTSARGESAYCREGDLADRLRAFVVERLEELHARHLPGFRLPRLFAGHAVGQDVRADLAFTLGLLHEGGVREVAGERVPDAVRDALAPVRGGEVDTFYSYRVAETVARFGPFAGNPLLAPLGDAQREQIALACDSTARIPDLDTGLPPNYRAVLARCETARAALGLPVDAAVLKSLLDRTRALITDSPTGYPDDSHDRAGRFDVYGMDVFLFTEPMADALGEAWTTGAASALRLAGRIDARNGAAVTWGRSTGSLAVCVTVELAGLAARHDLAADAGQWAARAEAAFAHLRDCFADGLVTDHSHRSPDDYRGPHRRLQMTLDVLGKLADAANHLDGVTATPLTAEDRDEVHWFDEARNAGVWTHRSSGLAFVLPLVDGAGSADYLPAPRNPGLFEVPVDSDLVTGVPMALLDGVRLSPAGLPVTARHTPDGLETEHHGWRARGHRRDGTRLGGGRRARYRVEGATLHVEEELWFDGGDLPDAVGLQVAETAGRPLTVRFEAGPDALTTTVDTAGLKEYRSFWAELPRVHQVDLAPAPRIRFSWSVTPKLRVMTSAYGHKYDASLYGPLADRVVVSPLPRGLLGGNADVLTGHSYGAGPHGEPGAGPASSEQRASEQRALEQCDVVHIHWPEWTGPGARTRGPEGVARHRALIATLRGSGVRIVWTQHNLVPHHRYEGDEAIYRAWAEAADAVVHHSEWGRERALARYRYGAHTVHRVIPHGHFGAPPAGAETADRAAAEKELGLRPGALRLGVIGEARRDKLAGLAMRAVAASHREDLELLVLSLGEDDQPVDDPRIVTFPRERVPAAEFEKRLSTLDAALMPFATDAVMLTTGAVADVVGRGLPSLVSRWPFLTEILGASGIPYGETQEDLTRCLDTLTPEALGDAARAAEELQERYAWPRVAELHHDLLRELGTTRW